MTRREFEALARTSADAASCMAIGRKMEEEKIARMRVEIDECA